MTTAIELFEESLGWLRENYGSFRFYVERDVVWTIQEHIRAEIEKNGLNLRVFNDYGILPGSRRKYSADLAILGTDGTLEVVAEFKYEPSHHRQDIPHNKLPVVGWGIEGVAKDMMRIEAFVNSGKAKKSYAIFIDESGYFRHRMPYPNSEWIDWEQGISILWKSY